VVGQARAAVEAICSRRGVRPTFDFYNDVPAAAMSPQVVAGLERAAALLELDPLHLSSGAGHDAQNAATAGVPTGMIFVRSSGGSHNPSEHAESSDAAAGTRLLLATVAALSGA
jgi:acetylornithine deacetylase/succinyl-diaminopimelate desuccinylase-like protein